MVMQNLDTLVVQKIKTTSQALRAAFIYFVTWSTTQENVFSIT
jgi:hypothetical protein